VSTAASFQSIEHDKDSFKILLQGEGQATRLEQDISAFKEAAAASRQQAWDDRHSRKGHWRPYCTIPDIVAIDILNRFGLNVHAPEFSHDPNNGRRLKQIISSEYPELLTGTYRT